MDSLTYPAIIDGSLVSVGEACVPIRDEGFLRGDGAFEVVLVYGGHPFALEEHLERLAKSCRSLRLEYPHELLMSDIGAIVEHCPRRPTCAMRIILTRGGIRLVFLEPHQRTRAPSRLAPVVYQPQPVVDGSKTLSYAGNMQALRLAREAGFDDALLVTPDGRVLEAQTAAVFWVTAAGVLCTPPLEDGILDSITRRVIVGSMDVVQRSCTQGEIMKAREAFLAGTVKEVQPVSAIGAVELPDVPGHFTRRASQLLMHHIKSSIGVVLEDEADSDSDPSAGWQHGLGQAWRASS